MEHNQRVAGEVQERLNGLNVLNGNAKAESRNPA
jgi:hypothetical protein